MVQKMKLRDLKIHTVFTALWSQALGPRRSNYCCYIKSPRELTRQYSDRRNVEVIYYLLIIILSVSITVVLEVQHFHLQQYAHMTLYDGLVLHHHISFN
jgi:hypothetical protein